MKRTTIERLIHADSDYCLPYKEKVNSGEPLNQNEQQERIMYGIHHFSNEYNLLLKYFSDKNARVIASNSVGDRKWRAVYDLGEMILSCFFDKSESPEIVITIFSPEAIEDKVREIENVFGKRPLRKD